MRRGTIRLTGLKCDSILLVRRCEQAGLMDEGLLALLELREAELDKLRGTAPHHGAKTARAVKHE